jgi:hypothetical protein
MDGNPSFRDVTLYRDEESHTTGDPGMVSKADKVS